MENSSKPNRFFARILKLDYEFTPEIDDKLERNRIQTSVDLRNITDDNLMRMYAFTPEEVKDLRETFEKQKLKAIPRYFYHSSLEETFITTGNKKFDEFLGGNGVGTGRIMQLSGSAGAGKTQFCLKLCLTVQLSPENGGLDGEALYLETEDCFRPSRVIEIAETMNLPSDMNQALKRIHCFSRFDNKLGSKIIGVEHLINILNGKDLENFLKNHKKIKLFIIDSVSYLFRYDYQGTELCRLHQQMTIGQRLKYLASTFDLAIVLTNQVKFSQELPSMGDIWNSIPSTALLLRRIDTCNKGFEREATIIKTISRLLDVNDSDKNSFKYRIDKSGIVEVL